MTKDRRHMGNRKITKKNKKLIRAGIVFGILVVFLMLSVGVLYFADAMRLKDHFGMQMTVNGQKVRGLTAEEAADQLNEHFKNHRISVKENDEQVYGLSLGDAGYSLDTSVLIPALKEIIKNQEPGFSFMKEPEDVQLEYAVLRAEDTFLAAFTAGDIAGERADSVNAYLTYNEDQRQFEIIPEVYGNKILDTAFQAYMNSALEVPVQDEHLSEIIEVNLDDSVYIKPEITQENEELQGQMNTLNQEIGRYQSTTVTYLFGDSKEVIDGNLICSWLVVENNTVQLPQQPVRDYVTQLATEYNTIYRERNFKTTGGETVKVEHNEYGYRIDQEAEFQKLYAELSSGESVEREPVYAKQGYKRNGKDDLVGSYIEVSIDKQHLWLYKDGVLITETDIVSGKPEEETATYKGAWPIAYKASPYTLSSDLYGYEVAVNYWMPFVYGQGLHDMEKRTEFGGEIYKTNGSHGCVNLPKDQAKIIFDTIAKGYPIILY